MSLSNTYLKPAYFASDKGAMEYAIEARRLAKQYGGQVVLEDISFRVAAGDFYALVGKNGAGKSTLMRLLMRYERPTSGRGWIFGRELATDSQEFNSEVAYVSESIDYALPWPLETFFAEYRKLHPRWDNDTFEKVTREMNVSLHSQFRDLSRGQKMQVAFAAAIASRPKLLMLDEITAVMDAHARSYFMQYLGRFCAEGGTVMMATNIVSEVQHFAKQVLLLHEGSAKLNCPVKDIPNNFFKLRRMPGIDAPIFHDPACAEVTLNSDTSVSYVLPLEAARHYDGYGKLRDNRGITIEEIFIYFTRNRWK